MLVYQLNKLYLYAKKTPKNSENAKNRGLLKNYDEGTKIFQH